ncbi:MAG: GlsB/YeaQ/YmgE family stress response membrane protein [Bacillota bacterium]|nr:GlsB/YeaQ/YmgE family stress response membrane protein [Bacillota bacterium]
MGIVSWIIFGGLAGWVASKLTGHDASMGILANVVVGIIGALVGGFVMSLIGKSGVDGFNIYSFLVAVGGSVLFLRVFKGRCKKD